MKWIVTRTVQFSKIIEADSKEEALEYFGDADADTKLVKETARKIKEVIEANNT